jgi:hypothetical protein
MNQQSTHNKDQAAIDAAVRYYQQKAAPALVVRQTIPMFTMTGDAKTDRNLDCWNLKAERLVQSVAGLDRIGQLSASLETIFAGIKLAEQFGQDPRPLRSLYDRSVTEIREECQRRQGKEAAKS